METGGRRAAGTYHHCDVVPVWEGEGPVHTQHVKLAPQERLQVRGVQAHDLCDVVQAPRCGVLFYKEVCSFIHGVCLENLGTKRYKIR